MLLPFAKEFTRTPEVIQALDLLAHEEKELRGAVFTVGPVVDAILDLVGYIEERPLHKLRLLEPSFGEGDFLFRAVERLVRSYFASGGSPDDAEALADSIIAVEVHIPSFEKTRERLKEHLLALGIPGSIADTLASRWLVCDDFLLYQVGGEFDVVVGNPPYVRQEKIPKALLKEYRSLYKTMYDRADLYIPFYEKCLDLLAVDGRLGFICADRWVKNKYGGPLREKIAQAFHLEYFIDVGSTNAFDKDVLAYPSITIVRNRRPAATRVPKVIPKQLHSLERLVTLLQEGDDAEGAFTELSDVTSKRDPWLLDSPQVLGIVRGLEQRFPTLEEAGCKVTIGVATGCDRVFIGDYKELPVEQERKLPLLMANDLKGGEICWSGKGIVNPFLASGQLASFDAFPEFAHYIEEHSAALKKRHVAKKNPQKWYRTIDRIHPWMVGKPKLVVPDIKGDATIVLDEGEYYPHHNLYVIFADEWELRALQAVLRSSIALMFVAAYSVRMSGGFLRFQAQYLRRIRLPHWETVTPEVRMALVRAVGKSREEIDEIVFPLYGLDEHHMERVIAFTTSTKMEKAL